MTLKREDQEHRGHPAVWAFLTIVSFPIVLMASDALGARGLWPFAYAILATLAVLILELLVRGGLWPFEKGFVEHIGHPDTPIRILIFIGATLLVLETALIFTVATDRRIDPELVRFVAEKQCSAHPDQLIQGLCGMFRNENDESARSTITQGDLISYVLRTHAASTWFPSQSLSSCGEQLLARSSDAEDGIIREATLMSCTAWTVGEHGELMAQTRKTTIIGASLQGQPDGDIRLLNWTEDPNSSDWSTTLGTLADSTRQQTQSLAVLPALEDRLQQDALQQARALLKK